MAEKEIGSLIRYGPGGKVIVASTLLYCLVCKSYTVYIFILKLIKQCLGYYPWINMAVNMSPITRTVLKVCGYDLYLLALF